MQSLYNLLVLGKEKALVGGATAGLLSLLAQVGISGNLTVKEVVFSACNWVVAHGLVYLKRNA